MRFRRLFAIVPLALALTACSDDPCDGTCPIDRFETSLYVVNAAPSLGPIRLYVDYAVARNRIEPRASSGTVWLHPGLHVVALERPGSGLQPEEFDVELRDGVPRVLVALPAGNTYDALVTGDTGSVVPDGATKVRVINAVEGSSVDIWRTQPDFATPVRVQSPFPFEAVSPYLQSTPGTWTVTVTPRNDAATSPANPLATASLALASGQRGTFVLVPGATGGSVQLVPVKEF
jgi:hypothetical protein